MTRRNVQSTSTHEELTDAEFEQLKDACLKARDLSYSPYSKFRVGCALITEDNKYYVGANIENASYPVSICAERTAISNARMHGLNTIKALAISADNDEPISPCGICRQFIREFAPKTPVFMFDKIGSRYIKMYLDELLPMSFGPDDLDKQLQ